MRKSCFSRELFCRGLFSSSLLFLVLSIPAIAQQQAQPTPVTDRPWMNKSLSAEQRSQLLVKAMNQEEKLKIVFGYFSTDAPWKNFTKPAEGLAQSAGYIEGSKRLGIPTIFETDAGVGVASQ